MLLPYIVNLIARTAPFCSGVATLSSVAGFVLDRVLHVLTDGEGLSSSATDPSVTHPYYELILRTFIVPVSNLIINFVLHFLSVVWTIAQFALADYMHVTILCTIFCVAATIIHHLSARGRALAWIRPLLQSITAILAPCALLVFKGLSVVFVLYFVVFFLYQLLSSIHIPFFGSFMSDPPPSTTASSFFGPPPSARHTPPIVNPFEVMKDIFTESANTVGTASSTFHRATALHHRDLVDTISLLAAPTATMLLLPPPAAAETVVVDPPSHHYPTTSDLPVFDPHSSFGSTIFVTEDGRQVKRTSAHPLLRVLFSFFQEDSRTAAPAVPKSDKVAAHEKAPLIPRKRN
jgi:hypothetical protein